MTTNEPRQRQAQAPQAPQSQPSQQSDRSPPSSQRAAPGNGGAAQRSENLLPPDAAEDGRYDVAEEINLDQQSDAARRVGQAPDGATAEAIGRALQKDQQDK